MSKRRASHKNWIKGQVAESIASQVIHEKGYPILISPRLLRSLSAGQVDLCIIRRLKGGLMITIYEVKSRPCVSYGQRRRLLASAKLLSSFFNCSCELRLFVVAH